MANLKRDKSLEPVKEKEINISLSEVILFLGFVLLFSLLFS